jgi:hypothetical protein
MNLATGLYRDSFSLDYWELPKRFVLLVRSDGALPRFPTILHCRTVDRLEVVSVG